MAVDRASYERLLQYRIPEVEQTLRALVGVPRLVSVIDKGIENGKNRGAVIVTEAEID